MMSDRRIVIGRRQRPLIGWGWHIAALASAIAIMFVFSSSLPKDVGPIAVGGPVTLALFVVPWLLYRQGHRHFVRSALDAERTDPRSPVLYLRSFRQEPQLRDHEEALARIFSGIGPFLAIGDPSDPVPQLAAWRDYLPDDAWQDVVLRRLASCQLAVLVAGATPGLAWEVEQCRLRLDPARLLIIVPAKRETFETFTAMCTDYGVELGSFEAFGPVRGAIAGIVTFDAAWRPALRSLAKITVLDPFILHQDEEACWRETLRQVPVIAPSVGEQSNRWEYWQHWRALPLLVVAAILSRILI